MGPTDGPRRAEKSFESTAVYGSKSRLQFWEDIFPERM